MSESWSPKKVAKKHQETSTRRVKSAGPPPDDDNKESRRPNKFNLGQPRACRIVFSDKDRNQYQSLAQIAEYTGYHPVYLRRLLLAGKIRGRKASLGRGE